MSKYDVIIIQGLNGEQFTLVVDKPAGQWNSPPGTERAYIDDGKDIKNYRKEQWDTRARNNGEPEGGQTKEPPITKPEPPVAKRTPPLPTDPDPYGPDRTLPPVPPGAGRDDSRGIAKKKRSEPNPMFDLENYPPGIFVPRSGKTEPCQSKPIIGGESRGIGRQ